MFASHIETGQIYRLNRSSEKIGFGGSGKSNRRRRRRYRQAGAFFFNTLQSMNIALKQTVALPDHADITAADLPNADVVIITEKDAIKFSDGHGLNHVWVLPVYAIIERIWRRLYPRMFQSKCL